MEIQLNASQAITLASLIERYADGESVLLTEQSGGSIHAAFLLKSFSIDTAGTAEEE